MTPDEFRHALKRLGLSQARAARFLGVNVSTVERWTAGIVEVSPTAERFLRLYEANLAAGWSDAKFRRAGVAPHTDA